VALLVIDLHVPTHGALTLSGLVAMAVGLTTLFHNAPSPYHTNVWLVVTVTALLGGFWAFAMGKAIAIRRRPPSVGPDEIVGMEGVVRDGGYVFVHGELWRAHADEPLREGQHVLVERVEGLTLDVRPE
jgi:membrane-bound serine protease (ClpP class)